VRTKSQVKLLSRRQVAAILGVSERTVTRLSEKSILPKPLHVGRAVRWPESEILSAIHQLAEAPAKLP